jgi:hypothetical protein
MMNQKKGDTVILCGFTGIKLGVFEVTAATKKTLTLTKANGDELIFDRKTGKQINVEEGKEKYANRIIEDDGSYVAPTRSGAKKKATKKPAKKQPEPVEEDEDEADEDEEEEEPKPVKKGTKKAAPKAPAKKPDKKAPVVEEDDEDDDDEFEEIDD